MTDTSEHIELTGPGPFEMPFAADFVSLLVAKDKDFTIIEFRAETGQTMYLPISNHAVPGLVEALATLPAVHGSAYNPTAPTSDKEH